MLRSLTLGTLLFLMVTGLSLGCGQTQHLQGKNLYTEHCNNCHLEQGQGLRQLIPPLAGADYLAERPADVVRGIRYGMNGPMVVNGLTYNYPMPGNIELSEFQIVNIMNYINTAWGNELPLVTVAEVRQWLDE